MLQTLSLENFKRHADTVVDLSSGLNLITGPNYSGKSSLLHAIRYALEGATAVPGGKAVATNWSASDHAVTLKFTAGDHEYEVSRSSRKATLKRDGETIAKSASAVTSQLDSILGMPGQLFSKLRYGKQKETEALLTLGAGELHKIIGEVSKVDVVNDVIAKCGTAASECRGGLETLPQIDTAGLRQQEEETTQLVTELHTELEALVKDIDQNNAIVTSLEDSLRVAEADVAKVVAANEERENLTHDAMDLVKKLDAARAELSVYEGAGTNYEEAQSVYQEHFHELQEKQAKVQVAEQHVADRDLLKQQLASSESELEKYQKSLTNHPPEKDLVPLQEVLAAVTGELGAAQSKLRELKGAKASGVCPSCNRPYDVPEHADPDAWHREITGQMLAKEQEVGDLLSEQVSAERALSAARLNNESLSKVVARVNSLEDTVADQKASLLEAELKVNESDLSGQQSLLARLTSRTGVLQAAVTEAHQRASSLSGLSTKVQGLESRLMEVNTRVNELGPVEQVVSTEGLRQETEAAKAELNNMNAAYLPKSQEYTKLAGALEVLRRELASAAETEKKRSELESRLNVATELGKYLRKNRDRFMSSVWGGVMGRASSFASACTGGAISQVDRDEKGKFTFIEEGHPAPIEAASGAQRSIMGLGVQLAMASMLPSPLSTIMLDEPGADMDAERSLALTSLLAADHHQLIMVSHRELDGAVANNTIALGG